MNYLKQLVAGALALLLLSACDTTPTKAPYSQAQKEGGASTASTPSATPQDENIVYIGEKMFATQLNDVWLNPEDYEGKTIRYEGIYHEGYFDDGTGDPLTPQDHIDPATGKEVRIVMRFTDGGCCGSDGIAGIELIVDDSLQTPRHYDWVELTCHIELVDIGTPYPAIRLHATKIMTLSKRGAEYVPN